MFWYLAQHDDLRPRFYLSGLPKSGLHLLNLMVQPVCKPMDAGPLGLMGHWVCSFTGNSFSGTWKDLEYSLWRMSLLKPGYFYQGHYGWTEEMDKFLEWSGIAHVFVYRDLRDVAVSQAFHISSEDDKRFFHPAKDAYRLLGNFDEILKAVIVGMGPFPGLMARWEDYAPWLDCEHTLSFKYQTLREEPRTCATKILEHGIGAMQFIQKSGKWKVEKILFDKAVEGMVEITKTPQFSPTFRKGKVGGWEEHFTEEHRDLFKETDTEGWLVKLGFVEEEDW